MEKTVFLLIEKWQFDGEENLSIEVYETYEKAKEKFNEFIKEEKEYLNDKDEEYYRRTIHSRFSNNVRRIEEYEDYFSYYKDGFYTEENYTLQIEKRGIK